MSFSTNTQSLIHRETRCRVLLSITNITKNVCSMIHKPSIIMHLTYIYIYIHIYLYTHTHTHKSLELTWAELAGSCSEQFSSEVLCVPVSSHGWTQCSGAE